MPTAEPSPSAGPPAATPPSGVQGDEEAPAEELLKRGARRKVSDDRAVALAEVTSEAARLDVLVGPTHLQALLPVGGSLEVGGSTLEILALEPPRAVRYRLRPVVKGGSSGPGVTGGASGPGAPPEAPLRSLSEAGPLLRLAGLTLCELPDGTRIGVGNVRREGRGPAARLLVTLTVFPPGYAQDPTRGYDLHLDATSNTTLTGEVHTLRVGALQLAPTPGGEVELELVGD